MIIGLEEKNIMHSSVIISDFKKTMGKKIDIERNEKTLSENRLYLTNISLPVYALMRKCFYLLNENSSKEKYETLIRFERPIDINAQCDNWGGYNIAQYHGETSSFPLIGIVPFKDAYPPYKYDYDKIKI